MTKPLLPLFLILFLTVPCIHAQHRPFATTIHGDIINCPDSAEVLTILYSSAHCHLCMQQISDYAICWQRMKPNRQVFILISGENTATLRSETMSVKILFPIGKCPPIVYDRVPIAEQYTTLYQITKFPAAIIWRNDTVCTFYSYDDMFGKQMISFPK